MVDLISELFGSHSSDGITSTCRVFLNRLVYLLYIIRRINTYIQQERSETHASDTKGGKTFPASNASAALGRLKNYFDSRIGSLKRELDTTNGVEELLIER